MLFLMRTALGLSMLVSASAALAYQGQQTPPPPPTTPPAPPPDPQTLDPNGRFERISGLQTRMYTQGVTDIAHNAAGTASAANAVSDCLVRRASDKAADLVGGPLSADPRFEKLSKALAGKYSVCAQRGAGLPLFMLNSSLAETLVRRDNPGLQDRAVGADAPAAKAFYEPAGGLTIDSVARCVAVHSPGLAYKLISSPAGTAQEGQALAAAYAATPECGVSSPPPGITTTEQRSAFALALYSWTHLGR